MFRTICKPVSKLVQDFVSNYKEIAVKRVAASVEGFYESKVPLVFRAICELGCVCAVKQSARAHNLSQPWKIDELDMKSPKECGYLNQRPKTIFLYQSGTNDGRAAFGIYYASLKRVEMVFAFKTFAVSLKNMLITTVQC